MKKIALIALAIFLTGFVFGQNRKVSEIKPGELPKGVNTWIDSNVPGGTIARAGKIEENGTVTYAVVIESKGRKHSYKFDKDGNFAGKGAGAAGATPRTKGTPATKPPQGRPEQVKPQEKSNPPVAKPPVQSKEVKKTPKPLPGAEQAPKAKAPATEEAAPKK